LDQHSLLRCLLIAAICTLVIAPFFWFGNPSGHDFEVHLFSWMNVVSQWKHGVLYPRWADLAYWGYGEPTFLFYPPASWTLGASLGSLLPWRMVPGAFCWLALMLAAIAMYQLAKHSLSPPDALFAAIFYAANPYVILVIYWRSAFAELLAAALLPLLLLFVMQLNNPGFRPALWLSLILAAAWLTNVPASVMIHYSAAGLALLVAVREKSSRPLSRLAIAVFLAAGLASFYLVPAIYEQRWVNIAEVLSPGVRPQDNFLFTVTADQDHNHFNLLVSLVAVSEMCVLAVAIFFSRCNPSGRPLWLALLIWGILTTFFMFSISHVFWEHLPNFRYVQLPFRWLLCTNVVLALLLTMATNQSKVQHWLARGLSVVFLFAVVIFAGWHTQPPWWDTAGDIEEMRQYVLDGVGYEGVDEYVPAGADAYNLNRELPRLSDETGSTADVTVIEWRATMKHFRVVANKPIDLTVHLFNYPAWKATVNGKPAEIRTSHSGLTLVPLAAGENDVQINFTRTLDRTIGAAISFFSTALFAAAWIWTKSRPPTLSRTGL
jgi:uncharacterized membrane protein